MDCSDISDNIPGMLMKWFKSNSKIKRVQPDLYLSTREMKNAAYVGPKNWSDLQYLDPLRSTYIIIHGYRSSGKKPWVQDLKDKILEWANLNVIIVDWEKDSNSWNYVNAAFGTQTVGLEVYKLLLDIRSQIEMRHATQEVQFWSSLYFVGHSLGAHISARISNLLREDYFWRIKRITGLDPAKPCFQNVDFSFKLDHTDAEFVDIIHTQAGNHRRFNLGLREDLGHMDFYVNGGVVQPACIKTGRILEEEICSHKLARSYFIESIAGSLSKRCEFMSFNWNGSHTHAMENFDLMRMNGSCQDCPRMGIDAPAHYYPGRYMVFTGAETPYCKIEDKDVNKLQAALQEGVKEISPKRYSDLVEETMG
ncbi:hypothetical protein QAD02_008615 [Eretmocerus hayati]|uniref:Uncharacterized protein n=1 Tax=Eretmocerus hayati TaxID=131215 RepID=A0ACC2N739_9HYME|nr:hypothetical protein QAD02_008615 [Eretmocerus hayati]